MHVVGLPAFRYLLDLSPEGLEPQTSPWLVKQQSTQDIGQSNDTYHNYVQCIKVTQPPMCCSRKTREHCSDPLGRRAIAAVYRPVNHMLITAYMSLTLLNFCCFCHPIHFWSRKNEGKSGARRDGGREQKPRCSSYGISVSLSIEFRVPFPPHKTNHLYKQVSCHSPHQ